MTAESMKMAAGASCVRSARFEWYRSRGWLLGFLAGAIVLCGAHLSAPSALAAGAIIAAEDHISLEVRHGQLLRLDRPARKVFVADPEIADVQAHSATLIYILGKRVGSTSVFAVGENEEILFRQDVVVEHAVSRLRRIIDDLGLGNTVSVQSIDGGMMLTGRVTEPRVARDLEELAGRFIGSDEILLNRLTVTLPTQVNLRVRVAEMSREVSKIFGINLDAAFSFGDFVFGLANGRGFQTNGGLPFQRLVDQSGVAGSTLGSFRNGDVSIDGVLDALEREGLVSVLAEPNLTALSGETASFLAGGEFPVPVGTDNNELQIEFKQFGVSLAFTPTVLDRGRISLRVRPEVSDLSEKGAITTNGIAIPALATRRAETTVELGSGQSFAIGGLISNSTRTNLEKMPGLGDLPILGVLFRSTSFRRSESELVIIVTPYLVEPPSEREMATPLDGYHAPSQLDLILHGHLMRTAPAPGLRAEAVGRPFRLAGPAGFTID